MTLSATKDMQTVIDALIRAGRITRSAYEYAKTQKGYSDTEIIGARERARLSSASLEIQGAPLRYKPSEPIVNPTEPTRERQMKAGRYLTSQTVGKGEKTPLRRYRLKTVMEIHADKFGVDHKTVFSAFVGDADLHERVKVADLNRSGGGGGVSRLGGLGEVPQHVRDRHTRYCWVTERLTNEEKEVADCLVFHCITNRDGTPLSAEGFGAMVFPMLNDKSFHRGAAVMGFRHLVGHLAKLYHHPMCPRIRYDSFEIEAAE